MDFEHPMQEGKKFPKFPIFDASSRFWGESGLAFARKVCSAQSKLVTKEELTKNGYPPMPDLTHNRVTRLVIA